MKIRGLVALWDFKEEGEKPMIANGLVNSPLVEMNGEVPRIDEDPISDFRDIQHQTCNLLLKKLAAI